MVLKVFISKSFYYVQSRLTTEEHRLVSPQISLASRGEVLKGPTNSMSTGFFVPPLFPHFLHSDKIIHTFILNPSAPKARVLSRLEEPILFSVSPQIQERLGEITFSPHETTLLTDVLNEIFHGLLPYEKDPPIDDRIVECLHHIESLKVKRVSANALAMGMNLSRSRFLHLFKRDMNITFRGYLTWRRSVEGGILVAKGYNITEAAHNAGFHDSAHFSRVFKKFFGITLSSALQERMPVLVIGNDVDEKIPLERSDKSHDRKKRCNSNEAGD